MNKVVWELIFGSIILIISFFISGYFDIFENIVEFATRYEEYEIDEIITTSFITVILLFFFSLKRWQETVQKTTELEKAIDEIKVLKGILPICSYCKKIRDDEGEWDVLESYIQSHSDAKLSHGVCPECYKKQIEEINALPTLKSRE